MRSSFWSGRRVLVTGHTGFKGAWLSTMLLRSGARVSGIALAPEQSPNLFDLLRLERDLDSTIGNIQDEQAVAGVFERVRPEYVFHLAAQPLVRYGYAHPLETYATNVMGTAHLLERARRCRDTRGVIVVTSDKCYRNDGSGRHYREEDPLGGEDPYSSSKAAAELVAHAYAASYGHDGLHLVSARAGNVIGGGDWAAERLVPDIIRAVTAGGTPELRYPRSVRPWQHVLEPLEGYAMLAEGIEGAGLSGAWNFGPDEDSHLDVAQITCALLTALGRPDEWSAAQGEHPPEAVQLRLDSSKSRERLGWRPKLSAREAVKWTADWYRAWHEGEDARSITHAQIARYSAA